MSQVTGNVLSTGLSSMLGGWRGAGQSHGEALGWGIRESHLGAWSLRAVWALRSGSGMLSITPLSCGGHGGLPRYLKAGVAVLFMLFLAVSLANCALAWPHPLLLSAPAQRWLCKTHIMLLTVSGELSRECLLPPEYFWHQPKGHLKAGLGAERASCLSGLSQSELKELKFLVDYRL